MLKALRDVIKSLYYPLQSQGNWNSVFIDYETPHVERIWMQLDKYRVYLHKIHPCTEAFYHPHPWPSAMLICEGEYESYIGSEDVKTGPIYLPQWSAYQMTDPKEWHSVSPIKNPCVTIMITGTPYGDNKAKPTKTHRALTKQEFDPIFNYFASSENRVKMLGVLDKYLGT